MGLYLTLDCISFPLPRSSPESWLAVILPGSIVIASFLALQISTAIKLLTHGYASSFSLFEPRLFLNDPYYFIAMALCELPSCSQVTVFLCFHGLFYHVLEAPWPPVLSHLPFPEHLFQLSACRTVTLHILLPGGWAVVQWEGMVFTWVIPGNTSQRLWLHRDKEELLSQEVNWSLIFPKQS